MKLFQGRAAQDAAAHLYEAIVAQARRPEFYRALGVPDTLDGRFEMIAFHAFVVLRQLRSDGPDAARTAQALFDRMFADFDRSFREMGAGDLGVGRRVKMLAKQFYGRLAAYGSGLEGGRDGALADAIARNIYGGMTPSRDQIAAMTAYLRREASAVAAQDAAERRSGAVRFGAPPTLEPVS